MMSVMGGSDHSPDGSLEALRHRNLLRVVDVLRTRGTATRPEIAFHTGLSRSTIAALVNDLQERGVVIERERPADAGSASRGRPAAFLALDPSVGAAIGLDFDHDRIRVAVADLSSTVLAEDEIALDVDHEAEQALDQAAALALRMLEIAKVDRDRVIGVGAGLASPIDHTTGTVGSLTILPSWAGMRPAEELSRRLSLPVDVDNDANLGARAEHAFGAGRGVNDFVYVSMRGGIGAGLVLGGRLHLGNAGFAGEIGHVAVEANGTLCRCGNRGCLETIASSNALVSAYGAVHGSHITVDDLIALVRAGDISASRTVHDAGRAVGRVLADLCSHLNPASIILGGDLAEAGTPVLEGIRESIDRYAVPPTAQSVEVVPGVLGERAQLLGALALVIGNTSRLRSAGLVPVGHNADASSLSSMRSPAES
jgi:predicted NBD/HSP70 family sugar kinase